MKICEIFKSLSGETRSAGKPTLFIRCSNCNLNCSYCDTPYKNEGKEYSNEELFDIIQKSGRELIICTGGEPLLEKNKVFVKRFWEDRIVELKEIKKSIENGQLSLEEVRESSGQINGLSKGQSTTNQK